MDYYNRLSEKEFDEVHYGLLLVDDVDSKEVLTTLFIAVYDELPAAKKKK